MGFIDESEISFRKVIEQIGGPLSRLKAIEMAGVIFDAWAITRFREQFQVVASSGLEPMSLQILSLVP